MVQNLHPQHTYKWKYFCGMSAFRKALMSPLVWTGSVFAVIDITRLVLHWMDGDMHSVNADALWIFFYIFILLLDVWFRAALKGATLFWVQLVLSVPIFTFLILPPVREYYLEQKALAEGNPFETRILIGENQKDYDFVLLLFGVEKGPDAIVKGEESGYLIASVPENGIYQTRMKAEKRFLQSFSYTYRQDCRDCPDDTLILQVRKGEVSLEACEHKASYHRFLMGGKEYKGMIFQINRDNQQDPYLLRCFEWGKDAFTTKEAVKWLRSRGLKKV